MLSTDFAKALALADRHERVGSIWKQAEIEPLLTSGHLPDIMWSSTEINWVSEHSLALCIRFSVCAVVKKYTLVDRGS